MEKQKCDSIFVLGSILLLLLAQHAVANKNVTANNVNAGKKKEVGDEIKFEYIAGSEKSPEKWGDLNEKWKTCKHGKLQSPIDLSNKRVKRNEKSKDLFIVWKPNEAELINRGHDISIVWKNFESGNITIKGTRYSLRSCHWHTPSEHTVDGKRFDLEMHMVHLRKDRHGKIHIAVVGFLYNIGAPDPWLTKVVGDLPEVDDINDVKRIGVIDPNWINPGNFDYYRYIGSLTSPPCTEGVVWTLNKHVKTVSKEQLKKLRDAIKEHTPVNARPIQAHNDRAIHHYGQ